MRKFAVLTFRQEDDLPKAGTGIVSRLVNILSGGRFRRVLRPVGTVFLEGVDREIGYILQLPDFAVSWDGLSPGRRQRRLVRYLRLLERLGVEVICIPYGYYDFPREAMEMMGRSFIVDSAYRMRILALSDSVKYLMRMLKERAASMEVGIWGADGWAGGLFARELAPFVNSMVLGGADEKELYGLADEILLDTGLACPVTTDAARCLKDKQLAVMADECDLGLISDRAIVVYAGVIDFEHMEAVEGRKGPLWILSGWAGWPDGVRADVELSPWETLGVLQALSLMEGEMEGIGRALDAVKMRGFILPEGGITYDTFRLRYFRKRG